MTSFLAYYMKNQLKLSAKVFKTPNKYGKIGFLMVLNAFSENFNVRSFNVRSNEVR